MEHAQPAFVGLGNVSQIQLRLVKGPEALCPNLATDYCLGKAAGSLLNTIKVACGYFGCVDEVASYTKTRNSCLQKLRDTFRSNTTHSGQRYKA